MPYLIVLLIILINSISLTVLLKKKIEEMIPISVVGLILIVYIAGLFDNLIIGVRIIEIITILQLFAILLFILKQRETEDVKQIILRIITPGLCVYIGLIGISVMINKNRIFEDLDEFNHWALIIKNMFYYNSFGTNAESIVSFNEYPPFTAIFQYIFLTVQKVYREDTVIIAQNILYFSFVILLTKSITWKENMKKLIVVIPLIIFLPMIFYSNFFVNILVDGFLGIVFAYIIFAMFQEDEDLKFKWVKILIGEIALCLTKTAGIFLAVLSFFIILIRLILLKKQDKFKFVKELKLLFCVILILSVLLLAWYVKVNESEQRWEFQRLLVFNDLEETNIIINNFIQNIFIGHEITEKGFTVFSVILIFIAWYFIIKFKIGNNKYKFYTISMLLVTLIYLISILIIYITIFDFDEAMVQASFFRYISTIFLSFVMFQVFILIENNYNESESIFVIISLIILFIPLKNIQIQYIDGKNYINRANTLRNSYTKIKRYKECFEDDDKILYIAGPKTIIDYMTVMNNYELMPIIINKMIPGIFKTEEEFTDVVKEYDYVYVYQIRDEDGDIIKNVFEDKYILKNVLYKVKIEKCKTTLVRVK